MLATVDPRAARPRRLPSRRRDQGRGCGRKRRRPDWPPRAGPRAGGRVPSPAATTAASSRGNGLGAVPGRHRGRGGDGARAPRWPLAVHARPAPRPWGRFLSRAAPCPPLRARGRTRSSSGLGAPLGSPIRDRARAPLRPGHGRPRRSSATARPPSGRTSMPTADGFALELHEPVDAVAPGQIAVLYDRRCRRRSRRDREHDGVGSRAMTLAFAAGDAAYWGLAIFLVLLGVGSLFALVKLGLMFDKVSSLVGGTERDALAGRRQGRRRGSIASTAARQDGHRHRQRRLDGGQRGHRGPVPCRR